MPEEIKKGDLVLHEGTHAHVLDNQSGLVDVHVGPTKATISDTESPVVWDPKNRRFNSVSKDVAVSSNVHAPEGHYIVLTNPAVDEEKPHPHKGKTSAVKLRMGETIHMEGPETFALYPGQEADVIPGHRLRTDQYLICRVYNVEQARANWAKGKTEPPPDSSTESVSNEGGQSGDEERDEQAGDSPEASQGEEEKTKGVDIKEKKTPTEDKGSSTGTHQEIDPEKLTMGQLLVIRGTEVSYYIPPTGMEVLRDEKGEYVRNAASPEQLQYCILLSESGKKRFERGPSVVFPEPTETYVEVDGARIFRALELNPKSGIYVKVTEGYEDENGDEHEAGEELFITGNEQAIYYPRAEHMLIKYGEKEIHYGIAIPPGEGRYALHRRNGEIRLVEGPLTFLPNPIDEVIVKRCLTENQVKLWFPGSQDALTYNRSLAAQIDRSSASSSGQTYLTASESEEAGYGAYGIEEERAIQSDQGLLRGKREMAKSGFHGDHTTRGTSFSEPRSITLDTKYDGAVCIDIWSGFAVLVQSKTGKRRVEVGPKPILLKFDETLGKMSLSTGKPKNTDTLQDVAYLKVIGNQVSDIIHVTTSDHCNVEVKVSYRVNFEGDSEKWFDVDNYVKFLCDHARSILTGVVRRIGIEDFSSDATAIVRDAILGKSERTGDEKGEGGQSSERPGLKFQENGMRVYDVEVFPIQIKDDEISNALISTQRNSVQQTLQVLAAEKGLDVTRRLEKVAQEASNAKAETAEVESKHSLAAEKQARDLALARLTVEVERRRAELRARVEDQEALGTIAKAELERNAAVDQQKLDVAEEELKQRLAEIKAETEALVEKGKGISPDLIAALQAFGSQELIEKAAKAMAPMALLGGNSVAEVISNLFKGTGLEKVVEALPNARGLVPSSNNSGDRPSVAEAE